MELKDNYDVPIGPGDLVVYRAGKSLRIGRVHESQVTTIGNPYGSNIKVAPLERGARTIWRNISDVIRVHESTLTLAKLMGKKAFVEEIRKENI